MLSLQNPDTASPQSSAAISPQQRLEFWPRSSEAPYADPSQSSVLAEWLNKTASLRQRHRSGNWEIPNNVSRIHPRPNSKAAVPQPHRSGAVFCHRKCSFHPLQ